jgi:elongation factor G
MNRYKVPRLAFINKCDRSGADPFRVLKQMKEKLNLNAVLMQIPIGLESELVGVVDLVSMKAMYFEGNFGDDIRIEDIPNDLLAEAEKRREDLLDAASMYSDDLMEAVLEGKADDNMIIDAIRKGTLARDLTPVFVGSAYKNVGVQVLLDGVTRYLPSPDEVENIALDLDDNEKEIVLESNPDAPLVALAFKLEVTPYGQLTYLRVYQGSIKKGDDLVNTRDRKKLKVGRLARMHADEMEDITSAKAGDIVTLFGVDCYSGDTFTDGSIRYSMTSIYVPEPVISLSIIPKDNKARINMSKALNRFTK